MIIPILNCDNKNQLFDMIRFDASLSMLVKGSANEINSVTIKPGADGSAVEVFDAEEKKNWFLDWAFNGYKFDVANEHNEVVFEVEGAEYTTNVLNGTYTLDGLLTALKNAVEAIAPSVTIEFEKDEFDRIQAIPSIPLKFFPTKSSKGLLPHIGFKEDGQLKSFPVEYGLREVTLTVSSTSESATIKKYVEVYTEQGDALFSSDANLVAKETQILDWIPDGHGSFIYLHRQAQKEILDWLDRQGYRDEAGRKITKFAIVDKSDVNSWSTLVALRMFFTDAQNSSNDVFKEKAKNYEKDEIAARSRAVLSLDLDGDKKPDKSIAPFIGSGKLFLR